MGFLRENINERPVGIAITKYGQFTILFDTGSPCNVIDIKTKNEFFPNAPIHNTNVVLHGLGNANIRIVGQCYGNFGLGGFDIKEPIIIVEGLNLYPIMILGHQSMEKEKIKVSPPDHGIFIRNKFLRYCHTLDLNNSTDDYYSKVDIINALNKNHIAKLTLQDEVCIPPGKSKLIKTKIKNVQSGAETLVLPETCRIKGLSMTNAIYSVDQNKSLQFEVMNNLNKVLTLREGTLIGNGEVYGKRIMEVNNEEEGREIPSPVNITPNKLESINEKIHEINNPEIKEELRSLLIDFADVISGKDEPLGYTTAIKHKIRLKNLEPIYVPAYRLPHKYKDEIETTCNDLLSQGIIEESHSPYNFPLLCVPKKDRTWRVVVDFRKLNDVTIPDRYPVPAIDDILSAIGSHKYFTTLDLLSGFLQIPLEEESKQYTAFSTPSGHFNYTRMPFGLKSAPITFTRCMNKIYQDMIGRDLYIYLDDIIIFSNSIKEHLEKLRRVLLRLREVNLKIKLTKCNFFQTKLTYLGHTVSNNGLQVVSEKITAIEKFPTPKNIKNILQFLGVTGYYRRFIQHYSTIASPLTSLLKKDAEFTWGTAQQEAFDTLKRKLLNAPILIFPDYNEPFYIATDASAFGVGAVLLQKVGNKFHPISFYSRKLKSKGPDETAYSTIEREALGVVNALNHFKYIVFGYDVTILTDHKPLMEFFNNYHTSPKRTRWFLILQDFAAKISYIPGKDNIIADTLSRNPIEIAVTHNNTHSTQQENSSNVGIYDFNIKDFIKAQSEDEYTKKIIYALKGPNTTAEFKKFHNSQGYRLMEDLLYKQFRSTRARNTTSLVIVVPKNMINKVLSFYHGHDMSSHPGIPNTYNKIKQQFFWKDMYKNIRSFIRECHTCKLHKGRTLKYDQLLSYPTPNFPFERIHMDLITNFNETIRSNKNILVIIDALTRYIELIPLSDKTAKTCAIAFYNNFICKYGVPGTIITDNGGEFQNKFLDSLSHLLGFRKVNILPYRPEANGLVERTNRKVLDALRFSVGGDDPDWDKALPVVQFSINNTIHKATGMTPFEALYGYKARTPFDLIFPDNNRDVPIELSNVLKNANHRFHLLKTQLDKYNITMKNEYDSKVRDIKKYKLNDTVYVKCNTRNSLNYKLSPKFEGPYKIKKILENNKYEVESNGHIRFVTALPFKYKMVYIMNISELFHIL